MSDSFSEEGCHVVTSKSNSEETVCSCNHLTHFAVLIDYDSSTKVIKLFFSLFNYFMDSMNSLILSFTFSFFSTQLTEEDETILKIITHVGLSLSIVGILFTFILYSCFT